MPDPVSCSSTSTGAGALIVCDEVIITSSESAPEQSMSADPAQMSPGTTRLVERAWPQLDYGNIAVECSSAALGTGLVLAGAKSLGLGIAAGIKAGIDMAKCVSEELGEAVLQNHVDLCEAEGGTPGKVDDSEGSFIWAETKLECTMDAKGEP